MYKKKAIITLMLILTIISFQKIVLADSLTAQTIINKAENNMNYGNYRSTAKMVIQTTSGNKRVMEMEIWGKGNDNIIMKYTSPARIEGVTFLFSGEDIWSYFPKTERVRHLASHVKNQRMLGSSFSYQDFSGKIFDDYNKEIIKEEKFEGEMSYVIEGKAKKENAPYKKVKAWIAKADFKILKMEFYNDQRKVKNMFVEKYQTVNDKLRVKRIRMEDLVKNDETIFEYIDIETNQKFPDNFFNSRNLERISER